MLIEYTQSTLAEKSPPHPPTPSKTLLNPGVKQKSDAAETKAIDTRNRLSNRSIPPVRRTARFVRRLRAITTSLFLYLFFHYYPVRYIIKASCSERRRHSENLETMPRWHCRSLFCTPLFSTCSQVSLKMARGSSAIYNR